MLLDATARTLPALCGKELQKVAGGFVQEVSKITPVDTGALARDWHVEDTVIDDATVTVVAISNPWRERKPRNYASLAEAWYRDNIGPGDRNSLDFHRRTEKIYREIAPEKVQTGIEKLMKHLL